MDEAEHLYQESLELFRSGHLDQAVQRLEQAVRLNPQNPDLLEALGVLYEKLGRLDQAIETMKRLVQLFPQHIMAHTNLSRFYVQKGMILEAEQEQGEARRLAWRAELQAQRALGNVREQSPEQETQARAREIEERIERYRKVIALDPADVLGYFSLGSALLDAKRFPEARDTFQKAVSVDPKHSPSYFNLGLALESLGETSEAIRVYEAGVNVAGERGDMIPLKKMSARLDMLRTKST